jgi:hypothetical protein
MKNKNKSVVSSTHPQAWIAVSNNRQKIYDVNQGPDNVYLEDGQEFQIELYNPTQMSYVAKIYINGKSISVAGIVIKPGQRYFLDRFIDENRKLLFSTYDVENTQESKNAIANNGKIRVDFHAEHYQSLPWINTGTTTWQTYPSTLTIPANINFRDYGTYSAPFSTFTTGDSGSITYTSSTTSGTGTINSFFCSTASNGTLNTSSHDTKRSKTAKATLDSIETGRVEKGDKSDQKFGDDHGIYNSYSSYSSEYQILPKSAKPVEVSEIRSYCPGCGTRMKKQTWKFCPTCGESLD